MADTGEKGDTISKGGLIMATGQIKTNKTTYIIDGDTFEPIDEGARAEIASLKEDLSENVGDLKSAFNYKASIEPYAGNLIVGNPVIRNHYHNGSDNENGSYSYVALPVISGTTYHIYGLIRYLSKAGELIYNPGSRARITYYEYTADFTGTLFVTFYNTSVDWVISLSADITNIPGYYSMPLCSKTLLHSIGDSERLPVSQKTVKKSVYVTDVLASIDLLKILELSDGYMYSNGEYNSNSSYKTTDFIPMVSGDCIRGYKCRFIAVYNSSKTFVKRYPSTDGPAKTDTIHFVAESDCYVRISVSKTYIENDTAHLVKNEALSNYGKKYWASDYDKTMLVSFVNGYWNHGATSNDDYSYICIPVKANETYTAYPRTKFLQYYDLDFQFIDDDPNQNSQNPVSFTPAYDGYVYITFSRDDVNSNMAAVYTNSDLDEIGHGKYILDDVYVKNIPTIRNTLMSILDGKKIAQFGDSIMAGDGASALGPGERFAQIYGITCYEYAIGGATMGYLDAQHSHIIDQVDLAISDDIEPDIILIDGGTNDMHGATPNCPLGVVSDLYTQPSGADNFSDGFESVAYKIKNAWPDAMVIYVRAHNMSSRIYDRQVSYGERGIAIAEKWGFGVIDMYKIMNTQLPYFAEKYLSDSTHPNAEGYNHYYIPAIEQYLYERRNMIKI